MKPLVAALTVALVGVTTASPVPQRDYAKLIVGSWLYTSKVRPTRILVFHADGSWGVRKYDDPRPEEINGRRWRVEGDKLILYYPAEKTPRIDKILSFTRQKFVTEQQGYEFTFTRIEQPR
jgi:hypothetical protein